MKEMLVPIDKAGRVVLPKDVREELSINPGDLLKISIQGDEVTLKPRRETAGFARKKRALVFSTAGNDLLRCETVQEILAEARDARGSQVISALPKRKSKG